MNEKTPLRELKGVGEKTEKLFQKIGITTTEELLRYYPRTYDIYEEPVEIASAEEDKTVSIRVTIATGIYISQVRNLQVLTTTVADASGRLPVAWFNAPYLKGTIKKGSVFILRGKITRKKGRPQMEHPEIFTPAAYEEIIHSMQCIWSDERTFQQDDHEVGPSDFGYKASPWRISAGGDTGTLSARRCQLCDPDYPFPKICRSFSQPGNVWYSMNFCFLCWQYSS